MRTFCMAAALLLASTVAHAGETYNFDVGGRKIHIDPDRGIVSIPGVYETGPNRLKGLRNNLDNDAPAAASPSEAKVDPEPSSERQAPSSDAATSSANTANVAPRYPLPSAPSSTSAQERDIITSLRPSGPTTPTTPAVASAPVTTAPPDVRAAPVEPPIREASASSPTPLGIWRTEKKEGRVRIEPCGANLCGYAVNEKDQNGEKVLINMKPAPGGKWTGKIYDPNSRGTYDSTMSLQGSDSLRVEGCAMGGLYCSGQSWTHVN